MADRETAIYFTDEELDEILECMDETGAETIQEAVINAVANTLRHPVIVCPHCGKRVK